MFAYHDITISPMLANLSGDEMSGVSVGVSSFSFVEPFLVSVLSITATVASLYVIHFFFSLPMRRAEHARLFLDLLEGALARGQSIEEMILSVAASRDRSVGVRFHLLAAHIESGLRFSEALKKVPRFLPPQISAMLLAGEKLGDLKKVLPACREILRERPAGVRSAFHYMLLVVLVYSPAILIFMFLMGTFILPKFKEVFAGMGFQLWWVTLFIYIHESWLALVEIVIFLGLTVATVTYIGGPGLARWCRWFFPSDRMAWQIPWKRKRLQRTFSAMLAVLLDGGVPEAEAVRLAGDCTANEICRRHAQRIVTALQQGGTLDEVVRAFDEKGEFHWRLANATHAQGGFLDALRGWHEMLDAKAFQQEEAAAHTITSGIVILNGLIVGLVALGTFGMLIIFLDKMVGIS
jgi:type II secretory pathway component PulF